MPKTKFESVIFTAITAFFMVYIMTVYNIVIANGNFNNYTFLAAIKGMWIEYIIIGLCAFFITSRLAPIFAFKVVTKETRPIYIIFAIQTFMVVFQVTFASILGVFHSYGFTKDFIPNYFSTYCQNFIMAYPIQLLLVGPLSRNIFKLIFRRNSQEAK